MILAEYEDADVAIHKMGHGGYEIVLDVDDGRDIISVEEPPDMLYEQLVERGDITP